MQFTRGQEAALGMVQRFLDDPEEGLMTLTGYAGTGKTTLLQEVARLHGEPLLVTPTGKAAVRAREATGLETSTIHRLIYKPVEDPKTGEVSFARKTVSDFAGRKLKLAIIDEASMVNQKLWSELWDICCEAGFKILAVGDTFQLPPVEKEGAIFNLLETVPTEHRAHLDEVMRQALDSPIVRASMILREQPRDWYAAYSLLDIIPAKKVLDKTLELREVGGVTIAYTNKYRNQLNREVRSVLGYGEDLVENEPLLVQQNNYGIDRYNGEVVSFDGWLEPPTKHTERIVVDHSMKVNVPQRYRATFGVGYADGKPVLLCPQDVAGAVGDTPSMFLRKAAENAWRVNLNEAAATVYMKDGEERYRPPPLLRANYGYALTCHKSQGSEWDEVVVAIENWIVKPDTLMGRRWLYTAITRARHAVYIASI